jgi:LPXTG-motif cell wall-anchored protein
LRQVELAVMALVAVLVLSTPAQAQSVSAGERSASSQQYGDSGASSAPAVADGVRKAADNAGQGADAANDALSGTRSSDSRVAGLTELPDTGGVPPFPLVAGILLVSVGLLFRKILR